MDWSRRIATAVAAASPSIAFVITNATTSLDPALVVAAVVAVVAFAWQLQRREPIWHALAGVVVVGACAGVAAITGQARGFFLLPMLVPFTLVAACAGTLLVGRPLTGLVLNRLSGGPADWREVPRLRRIYTTTTAASLAVNIVNAAVQVSLYAANHPVALGAVHVITGPLNIAIVGVTVALVRRVNHQIPVVAVS
jgi:hypothetical protein